jgi:sulfatase modifying factor 1
MSQSAGKETKMDRKKCLLFMVLAVVIGLICWVVMDLAFMDRVSAQAELPKEIVGKDGAPMVLIPAGEFEMGTDPAEIPGLMQWLEKEYLSLNLEAKASWFEDEPPRHTVYVDAFYMDKYEVTNAQYRKFVQATGHSEPEGSEQFKPWSDENYNGDDQPVVYVTWEDAKAYAEWAGKRLPTEAEWEKAARGGLVGKRFPWGDEWPPPPKAGNFADEALKKVFPEALAFIAGYDDGYAYTAPVGKYAPNGYGLYDMAGNVWEWCADWYDKDYYASSPGENPSGPSSGQDRVIRSGGWSPNCVRTLRAADRSGITPVSSGSSYGFRCAGLK